MRSYWPNLKLQGPDIVKECLRVFFEYDEALSKHIEGTTFPAPTVAPVAVQKMVYRTRPLSRVFAPPNQAYCARSRFFASRQGKRELEDFVQDLRRLIAGMAADPLHEVVTVTIFMEGLRSGVAQTEVFRAHPASFERAVDVAWKTELNFTSSKVGFSNESDYPLNGVTPMDLSYTEDGEAEL